MITVKTLVAAGIAPTQARMFAQPLADACARFGIDSAAQVAGFVAQCRVESAGFSRLEEGLYYRTAERIRAVWPTRFSSIAEAAKFVGKPQQLANRVYANRYGNGDEASGDGWRYRGRGIKQLTFRDNYHDAAIELGRPYVEQPDLVAQPADACLTAAWFWHANKLGVLAESGQWDAITRVVNGPAMLQAAERRQFSDDALLALNQTGETTWT